jgi:hypothetical protein
MSFINHDFLNNISIILGILVILALLYGDLPEPHKTLWLICMPLLLVVNFISLTWLSKKKELFK